MAEVSADNAVSPDALIGRLFQHANHLPDHPAIVTPVCTISYARLARLVAAQARALADSGVASDATVGICCGDDVSHLLLCLATIYCGATSCTIPSHESKALQDALVKRCGAGTVLNETHALDWMSQGSDESSIAPAPEASILFSTSGTSGEPKLVLHKDRDLVAQAHRHIGSPQERFACLAAIEHNFAKRHRLYCVAVGATNVFPGTAGEQLIERCLSLDVNVLHVSAFQAQELLSQPDSRRLAGLRLKLGGSHVAPALRQQLRENITSRLQAGYGTTETGAIAFTDPDDEGAGDSVGRPLPGIDIRAVSPEREPLASGERGELAVRCDGMFRGYLGKPELTASRLENGWFYTGDTGYLDSEGRIHISGRIDDMFVFNSMNIYPQDIESVIREYPAVSDVVVLPRKSAAHGNIPVALVVLQGSPKKHLPALKKFVRKRVGIRAPRQYVVLDEIPTNASGKIARRDVMTLPDKSDRLREDLVAMLNPRVKRRVKPSLIRDFVRGESDIALRKFEMDSLERLELLLTLETGYNVVVPPGAFNGFRYLGDLVAYILSPRQRDELESSAPPIESPPLPVDIADGELPYVVRFFQRIFRVSRALVQLSKSLSTLENRLTPTEFECLYEWHARGQLLAGDVADNKRAIVTRWLRGMRDLMAMSGKQKPEVFALRRLAPSARLFTGSGAAKGKALLICFPPSGGRNLMMPNAALLQHADAAQTDVLMLSEIFNQKYRRGIPFVGGNLAEIIAWLNRQVGDYRQILTIGVSAGAYPALVAAGQLQAECALSVGGRFYRRRHLADNIRRLVSLYRSRRRARAMRIFFAYGVDDARDKAFAEFMARFSGGELLPVAFSDKPVGHEILRQLLDRGELRDFLAGTVFAGLDENALRDKANHSEAPPIKEPAQYQRAD